MLNKLFKDWVRVQWLSWMITKGIIHGTTTLPTWHNVAEWVNHAMGETRREEQIVKNVWVKTGYGWWPKDNIIVIN